MTLFGYKKKEFDKANQKVNNQLSEIGRLTDDSDVREKLQCVRREMSRCTYTKENRRNLKKIDASILSKIGGLIVDIQKKEFSAFFAHSDMILSTIKYSRSFGKYSLSEEERRCENILVESKIVLESEYAQLFILEEQKTKLISDSKDLPMGAKKEAIKRSYEALSIQEAARKSRIIEKTKVYNQNIGIINDKLQAQVYDEVPRIMSGKEYKEFSAMAIKKKLRFDKENAEIDQSREEFRDRMAPLGSADIASDFDTRIAEANHADAISMIDSKSATKMSAGDEFDMLTSSDIK